MMSFLTNQLHFCPAGSHCFGKLSQRNVREFFFQSLNNRFRGGKGHERITEGNLSASDFFYVVFNIFRIRGYDGAVIVVISLLKFIPLVKYGRIEDKVHLLLNQPADMPMYQLGRITFGFTGNGFDSQFVNLVSRAGRQHYRITQPGKKGKPEGVIFIHI